MKKENQIKKKTSPYDDQFSKEEGKKREEEM